MEGLEMKTSHVLAIVIAAVAVISINGQITTPCTGSMISTFTPCLNFITGSTSNGAATPTRSCCDALKSLTSSSRDCACLLITANVPVQLPINRTLSLSLPRACNMGAVPVQCKASGTPLPAPGPAALSGPAPAPIADSPLSPARASKAFAPTPETDASADLAPAASPPVESDAPTSPGIRPVLTPPPPSSPSASSRSFISPPSILLFSIGIIIFKSYY